MAADIRQVREAFNSMLRTDYIALSDTDKLRLLGQYYVDYFGYVPQVLAANDQLIVGRRGTGKTTLLYRVLVEAMRSWSPAALSGQAQPRTLAIYVDLSKCHSLNDIASGSYSDFEHVFVTEVCDAIREELERSWPEISEKPGLLRTLFDSQKAIEINRVRAVCTELAAILSTGKVRFVDSSGTVVEKTKETKSGAVSATGSLNAEGASVGASISREHALETAREKQSQVTSRLTIADVLQLLGELRKAAKIPQILLLVDEFSSLSKELQGRFTTLLRKILGNHVGLYVKLCAITDNYALGTSIILQRDLFELSLDLDAYIDRSSSLNAAMTGLAEQAERIIEERLKAYGNIVVGDVFEGPADAWRELSRSAMGVPRTLGIVLQHALSRATGSSHGKIRKTDIEAGAKYAGQTYLRQLTGAARDGLAIPSRAAKAWDVLIARATRERAKGGEASHFMLRPENEDLMRYLSMFFVIHLITRGRTTKKDVASRNLYCFDYGICLENNLDFASDKNVIRQQRFAYDEEFEKDVELSSGDDVERWRCPACGRVFVEADLRVAGTTLTFCPHDKRDLERLAPASVAQRFTEEEAKIIGAIRSADKQDQLLARKVADDVGCYVQKVSKFGEKLERENIIERETSDEHGRLIYFGNAEGNQPVEQALPTPPAPIKP